MKHLKIYMMAIVAVSLMIISCDKEKIITVDQLPIPAQSYLQQTYPGVNVTYAKEDSELFSTKYKVRLDNMLELEFDSDGNPIDIDAD